MLKIEVKAKLIITIPDSKDVDPALAVLAAEQHINDKAACFRLPNAYTESGIRIHTQDFEVVR